MSSNVTPINESRQFSLSERFFSITDTRGVIECGNDVFMRVSEYEPIEVIGKPHNLIRHPDMPRCVFYLFWEYLKAGKVIGAYVKNLAKDGRYYWVYALVSSLGEQHVSIRIKPSSDVFSITKKLYKELTEHENTFSGNRQDAMMSAHDLLHTRLKELGFANYDAFMNASLRVEMNLHANEIQKQNKSIDYNRQGKNAKVVARLVRVFSKLDQLVECGESIKDKQSSFLFIDKELHTIATNTKFRAARLGTDGKSLCVVSDEISRTRLSIGIEIKRLNEDIASIVSAITGGALHSSLGYLQLLTQVEFNEQKENSDLAVEEQQAKFGWSLDAMNTVLSKCSEQSLSDFSKEINLLSRALNKFNEFISFVTRMIQVLDFSYVTGQSLSASIESTEEFRDILKGLKVVASKTSKNLEQLRQTVSAAITIIE